MNAEKILPRSSVLRKREASLDGAVRRLVSLSAAIRARWPVGRHRHGVAWRSSTSRLAVVFGWQDDRFLNNAVLGAAGRRFDSPDGSRRAARFPIACSPMTTSRRDFARLKRRVKGQGREWVRWGDTGPTASRVPARHLGYLAARAAGVDVLSGVVREQSADVREDICPPLRHSTGAGALDASVESADCGERQHPVKAAIVVRNMGKADIITITSKKKSDNPSAFLTTAWCSHKRM